MIINLSRLYNYLNTGSVELGVDGAKRMVVCPLLDSPSAFEFGIGSPDVMLALMREAFLAGTRGEDFVVVTEGCAREVV